MMSPSKSNIVEKSWRKLYLTHSARQAVVSSFRIVILFSVLLLDMSYSTFSGLVSLSHPVIWFVELSLCILLLLQIAANGLLLIKYFWSHFFGSTINITEEQRKLMAISQKDRSFCTPQRMPGHSPTSSPFTLSSSPSYGTGEGSPQFISQTYPTSSPGCYQSPLMSGVNASTPYRSFLSGSSFHSFNASYSSLDRSLNVSSLSHSSAKYDLERSSLRSRRSASVPLSPHKSDEDRITNVDTLKRYIEEEEEREQNRIEASPENLNSGNLSFWNFGTNPLDFTHILRRFAYQLAPRSSVNPIQNSSGDSASSRRTEEIWGKFDVTEDDLYIWTEKLRKWLSFTIVERLKAQVDEVNANLARVGCEDTQIGEVGISTLKQIALTRGNMVSNLNPVIPYLDLTANQEYFFNRLRDLTTGCMSAFSWHKGGSYGKTWGEHLPTDAAFVMHLFCCYLDSRLPAQPKYPDGKTFTSMHFIKTPDKPNLERKDNLSIYQSSINPPHFQVVIGSEIINLPKGRNNMFQAMLFFLYHIKVKESGMLGRINLGMSGLNILWIFD